MSGSVLAIDAGTTGVTAVVVDDDGQIVAKGYQEFAQHFPQPGWVEHAPEEIWQATVEATRTLLAQVDARDLCAIGITNQRETVLLWDRETLGSPRRAIVWQDRRTTERCAELKDRTGWLAARTGLRPDPYFSATKLEYLGGVVLDPARLRVVLGDLAVTTARHAAVSGDHERGRAGRPLINGED